MQSPSASASALDTPLAELSHEMARLVERFVAADGMHTTAIPGLKLIRSSTPSLPVQGVYDPSLCIIAQGRKEVRLGDERYVYDPLNYLVASVVLPVTGQVIEASAERPYLSIALDIDAALITSLLSEMPAIAASSADSQRGLYLDRLDPRLLDAVIRLLRLLETPRDIAMLAPLALREIFYRMLLSPQGRRMREVVVADSQSQRISRAIDWLRRNFHQPLRIEDLAREVNLSPSTLHHRFKAVTAFSPLQYQKQLRLQEARRLMLCEHLEAAVACYRVGYESPSQFSREYSRLFGAPPQRDIARLRQSAEQQAVS